MSIERELNRIESALRPIGLYKFDADTLINAELSAYAAGLNILNEALEELEREAFVATAESFGLALRESLCGRRTSGASYAQRREMLNYRTSVTANDFNRSGIEKAIATSGINAKIVELKSESKIYVNCYSMIDPTVTHETAEALARHFTPAHLTAFFDFRVLNWDNIDARNLSFNDMDNADMTWDDIEAFSG